MSRRIRASSALLLGVSLVALSSCAADVGQTSQGIFGGVNDTVHTNVVGIIINSPQGTGECSGSLIAPNLVLTARHCVSTISGEGIVCSAFTQGGMSYSPSTAGPPYAAGSFYVTTDAVIGRNSPFTRVAEVWVPDNTTNQPMCGKDIALLRLATSITSVQPIAPRLDIPPRVQDIFTASGYGATNSRGAGSGTRRMREGLSVQYVGRALAGPSVVVMTDEEWLADTGTCQGDSGGPALDELGAVFGVLSRGDATSCNSPVYTRVDSYASWIRARAQAAATAGSYAPPSWLSPPAARPGAQGDECGSDDQCDVPLICAPTGTSRQCTIEDCSACPSGWVCNSENRYCIRDPNAVPPPPEDTGVPADASETPADGSDQPPAQMTGGCAVRSGARSNAPSNAWIALALGAAAVTVSRRARRR